MMAVEWTWAGAGAPALRGLLKARGMEQLRLARTLGLGPSTVNQWLSGKKTPTVLNLVALRSALGATADELLGLVPPEGKGELLYRLDVVENEIKALKDAFSRG